MIRIPLLLLACGWIGATADPAETAVKKLVEKEKMRPGGVLRVFRFPVALAKGWAVVEAMGDEADRKKLEAKEPSVLFFVDRKAGPMYSHEVEYWLVSTAKSEVKRLEAGWMPEVLDEKGAKVDKGEWWLDAKCRILGGDGPSIQEGQDAVKMDFMFAKMPAGSNSMTMYSCPATLPAGGSVAVAREGKKVNVAKAEGESFVFIADFFPRQDLPHAMTLVLYDRKAGKATKVELEEAPLLLDAKGAAVATDDGGKALGEWYADDAHSFLSRMSFGGK